MAEKKHYHDNEQPHLHNHSHDKDGRKHDGPEPGAHDHGGGAHGHVHGTVDPSIAASDRGLWAVKWSFVGLFITTLIQIVIFYFSGSIALLADAIHNLGDGCTAVPLGIAFILGKRKPSERFTYGYGRVEDLAGLVVVLT